ncbi:hypothetical protein PBY51_004407 [Eleginops maclovinus]|uniref:ARID domain-containing protein n=1 Tax=Eleginops maclovinus TaxID=56733 RepID=A0AAN8ATC1_ELEMC|nr:hypothetical protein PBY51_004407 [Eleginops maclovinus]
MDQGDQSETSQQTSSDEDKGTETQASPPVIEIHDSMTECEEEGRPVKVPMEEKAFVSSLHSFMKDRGTPIERIPHLGFKQINLCRIHKAVEKLGGYDSVTARRLWKKVYDELGGSPGSTSAATCTRRHYEKLVLPFERHLKGEEDKPLPPSKPRKPYKRNSDGKVTKAEKKRKRTQSEREMDSELEILPQRSPDASSQREAGMPPLWNSTSDRHHPDCSPPNRATTGLCSPIYAHLVQVPPSVPWTSHIPQGAGEGISPLEKKKRMAQASLNLPLSPQSEDKERPSVIHCSQSPARASSSGRNCNSSDSSPLPLSPSSSRSTSPLSVSSEDGPEGIKEKPASSAELPKKSVKNTPCSEEAKAASCILISKDPAGQNKDITLPSADSITVQLKDWLPIHKGSVKYSHPLHSSSSFMVRSDWAPTSTSSFTKVVPKSLQLLRPAPIRPQNSSVTFVKKTNNAPWLYQTEKRERSRTMLQKVPSTQQSPAQSSSSLPVSYVLSRDSRHQPVLHPAYFPNRMRLPQSQIMYRHVPMSAAHSALIGPAVYPYPYSIPLLNPQTGYPFPAMHPIYSHKL